jgi:hypothetical protein
MSTRYTAVDDDVVYPAVINTLTEEGIEQYDSLEYDDHITRLVVRFPEIRGSFQNMECNAGVVISNSETGHSAIYVEPCAFAGGYSWVNRKTLLKQGFDGRIVHRGEITTDRIMGMFNAAKEISQVGIVQLAEEWNKRVSGAAAISFVKSMNMLPTRLFNIFEEEMAERIDIQKAVVAQEIMKLAVELPLFQRVQVDQHVGEFMGIFDSWQTRLQNLQMELSI